MKEINITPLFYIQIENQWFELIKKRYNQKISILKIEYKKDEMLDLHRFIFAFCGVVIIFNKNVLE